MDKSRRLKVYSEKDYSELIDFPVELVGRDGVVRKYSYSDSVRIYQRRIESAHVRYSDLEIINAEISHCSKRLEQLHRSWKQRMRHFEREYIQSRPIPQERVLYERGKQFLRSYVERHAPGAPLDPGSSELNLVLLEDRPGCQVFYVNWTLFHPGTLLYAYRLDADDGDVPREEYHRYLALLRATSVAPDTEKLLHHECGEEVAFILTGPRATPTVSTREGGRLLPGRFIGVMDAGVRGHAVLVASQAGKAASPADAYRRGLEELRWNNIEAAFELFKQALEENPFHREAYWAVGELARKLDRWADAEPYLLMALKYFGEDARAHFYRGRSLLDRKQLRGAERAFQRAVGLEMKQSRGVGFLACTRALQGRAAAGAETLERGLAMFPGDGLLRHLAGPVRRALVLQRQGQVLLALTVAVVAVMVLFGVGMPAVWVGVGVLEVAVAVAWWQRRRRVFADLWAWTRKEPSSSA